VLRDDMTSSNFYDELQAGRYGSMELQRSIGPNLVKGLAVSVAIHVLAILIPWLMWRSLQKPVSEPARTSAIDLSTTIITPPQEEPIKNKGPKEEGGGGGGGGGGEETHEQRGARYRTPRLMRASDISPGGEEGISLNVLDANVRTTRPGEAATPIVDVPRASRTVGRGSGGGRSGIGEDDEGVGGLDDFGGGPGMGGGIGGGIGTGIGTGIGAGIGEGRGGGSGGGSGGGHGRGRGRGYGDGDENAGDLLAAAPAPTMPGTMTKELPKMNEVNIRANRGAVISKADRSPVVDWIAHHQKPIPATISKPENLNKKAGDVATWDEFIDEQGRQYTIYLLGRNSRPPQLNIFLVCAGKGTLLQDEGAKGETEVYKYGTASGDPHNPTVQLEQLPPGRAEARQMMAVFTAWWNHVKNTSHS
jgi:hypothetical protein